MKIFIELEIEKHIHELNIYKSFIIMSLLSIKKKST